MHDARGLCAGTRECRLRILQRLLLGKFAGRALQFDELTPEDIRRFIAEQLELRNAITITGALRAYLRWRAARGDAVQPLLGVIASPEHWSATSMPRELEPLQVHRRSTSIPKSVDV
jgi:integrase/recombinase XerC